MHIIRFEVFLESITLGTNPRKLETQGHPHSTSPYFTTFPLLSFPNCLFSCHSLSLHLSLFLSLSLSLLSLSLSLSHSLTLYISLYSSLTLFILLFYWIRSLFSTIGHNTIFLWWLCGYLEYRYHCYRASERITTICKRNTSHASYFSYS